MQRITQRPRLLPSFSAGIRHTSTEVPPRTVKRTVRVPLARLGDVVIPSAEEIRAKAAKSLKPSYKADISYLDNASNNFLAAKLARLGQMEEKTPKENEAPTPEEVLPVEVPRPIPTPEDIAALTAQRREERINRANRHLQNYVPIPEKSNLLRTEFAKSNVFMSPERSQPTRRGNLYRRSPQPRDAASRGAKGMQERSPQPNQRPRNSTKRRVPAAPPAPTKSSSSNDIMTQIEEGIDEAVFQSGHEPEYYHPEPPSSNLLEHFGPSISAKNVTVVAQDGTAIQIPVSKIDSFHKGSYARYVCASKEDYTTPPNTLGAVKVAERALSHQPHYNLTARDRTLEIVARASQSSRPKQN